MAISVFRFVFNTSALLKQCCDNAIADMEGVSTSVTPHAIEEKEKEAHSAIKCYLFQGVTFLFSNSFNNTHAGDCENDMNGCAQTVISCEYSKMIYRTIRGSNSPSHV